MRTDDLTRWALEGLAGAQEEAKGCRAFVSTRANDFGTWLQVELRTRFTSIRLGVVVRDDVGEERVRLLAFQLATRAARAGVLNFGGDQDGELRGPDPLEDAEFDASARIALAPGHGVPVVPPAGAQPEAPLCKVCGRSSCPWPAEEGRHP